MKKSYQNLGRITKLSLATTFFVTGLFPFNIYASSVTSENILFLVNKERTFYNLQPFRSDTDLTMASKLKSKDMVNRDYFEHYAHGLAPWDFINGAGYNYLYAGENLAMDFNTSEGIVNAWMASPAHRANLLNPDFEDAGVGVVKGEFTEDGKTEETYMVTNMLGRKKPIILEKFNQALSAVLGIFGF